MDFHLTIHLILIVIFRMPVKQDIHPAASHSIVGIQPKLPFYNLFESLKHVPDNKVIIFRPGVKQKETGSGIAQEPDYAMVETGESQSLPETILCFV